MKQHRVIFTGGRNYPDKPTFEKAAFILEQTLGEFVPVVGDCPTGLDKMVRDRYGERAEFHVAEWGTRGLAAGPIRNQHMVDSRAGICVAFLGGAGTSDCVSRAARAGIPRWFPDLEDMDAAIRDIRVPR